MPYRIAGIDVHKKHWPPLTGWLYDPETPSESLCSSAEVSPEISMPVKWPEEIRI
jgi:hypothetical protein